MENTNNLFGINLRKLVDANENSYEEAAETLEISLSFLQQLMRGERVPSLKTINNVRHKYKVTFNDLLESPLSSEKSIPAKRTVAEMTTEELKELLRPEIRTEIYEAYTLVKKLKEIWGEEGFQAIQRVSKADVLITLDVLAAPYAVAPSSNSGDSQSNQQIQDGMQKTKSHKFPTR
ncbi:MAG TPA: hypothetical protein VIG33_14400 [Pseudobdellovibrionaceae bacterium]|jgi:transcriptional regulator with XRE-family HTH domain